jgi:hypothetical protein
MFLWFLGTKGSQLFVAYSVGVDRWTDGRTALWNVSRKTLLLVRDFRALSCNHSRCKIFCAVLKRAGKVVPLIIKFRALNSNAGVEVSGQLHTSAALPPEIEHPLPISYEGALAGEQVRAWFLRVNLSLTPPIPTVVGAVDTFSGTHKRRISTTQKSRDWIFWTSYTYNLEYIHKLLENLMARDQLENLLHYS